MNQDMKALRIKSLTAKLGVTRATIYDWMNPKSPRYDPTFPKPFKLGMMTTVWLSTAVDEWLVSKSQGDTCTHR